MRSWIIAAGAILAVGMVAPSAASAAPATGQTAIGRSVTRASPLQDVRYVVRCRNVRVLRHDRHGHAHWVVVRRCRRHYYR